MWFYRANAKVGLQGNVTELTKDLPLTTKVCMWPHPFQWMTLSVRHGRKRRFQESTGINKIKKLQILVKNSLHNTACKYFF